MSGPVQQIKDVKAAMSERILAYLGDEITGVVVGKRARALKFKPPLVWVMPVPDKIDSQGLRTLHEDWYLSYWVLGLSSKQDIEEAEEEAEALAVKASAALLLDPVTGRQDRTLGDLVHYIKRTGWAPADTRIVLNPGVHAAGLRVQIRFETKEVE